MACPSGGENLKFENLSSYPFHCACLLRKVKGCKRSHNHLKNLVVGLGVDGSCKSQKIEEATA